MRALTVGLVAMLVLVASASGKTLNRAVLVGTDGTWVRVTGSAAAFENLARDPGAEPARARGGFVRLYFVGPGDFPANRARYCPRQRCIALDWATYQLSCRVVRPELASRFRRAHALPQFTRRPTVLARLNYVSPGERTAALAGLTGSIELAVSRAGEVAAKPSGCYALTGTWRGPAAGIRPEKLFLCRTGVWANGYLFALHKGVWQWFRLNFGSP